MGALRAPKLNQQIQQADGLPAAGSDELSVILRREEDLLDPLPRLQDALLQEVHQQGAVEHLLQRVGAGIVGAQFHHRQAVLVAVDDQADLAPAPVFALLQQGLVGVLQIPGVDHLHDRHRQRLVQIDVVALTVDGVTRPDHHREPVVRRSRVVLTADHLQSADDAPAVQVLVVVAQVAHLAKLVDCLLDVGGLDDVAVGVVVADVLGADVGQRREERPAVLVDLGDNNFCLVVARFDVHTE